MADAMQALGQHMHEEAADELMRRERHGRISARPFDPVILDIEGDTGRVDLDQPAVGDGDAVSVAGQVSKHRFRPGKGAFSV